MLCFGCLETWFIQNYSYYNVLAAELQNTHKWVYEFLFIVIILF